MSSFSSNENESKSNNIYGDEDNNKTIANIENIPKNDSNYFNNKSMEIEKTELNKPAENKFLENCKNIFDYYYSRATIILNLKKDIRFPNLDLSDFNSHVNFLKEVNRIFLDYNKNNIVSEYCENEELQKKISKIMFDNIKEKIDESDFLKIKDLYFSLEKFNSNSKVKPEIIKSAREIKKFQNILIKLVNKFKELMSIKDYFSNSGKNEKEFDSRGDLLIPNTTNILKRGSEDYNPPYGWMGVGLNVSGKYKGNEEDINGNWLFHKIDSKWANAYLGFNQENSSNNKIIIGPKNIKKYLRDLVAKDEMLELFERKVDFDDKRHWLKKYKKGIYVYSKIENVEKDACEVTIGNTKYKIILMVKVKIDEISQPKNEDVWVLDKKFIRVYRILLKQIINKN